MNYEIIKISEEKIIDLVQLEIESEKEGCKFVGRAIREFLSGDNNFTAEGEILYAAYMGKLCIGVCGLNIDPYTNEKGIGRVRHLYVLEQFRHKGIATALLRRVIDQAKKNFKLLRLKSTPSASKFYNKLGFIENIEEHESHRMIFEKE